MLSLGFTLEQDLYLKVHWCRFIYLLNYIDHNFKDLLMCFSKLLKIYSDIMHFEVTELTKLYDVEGK